VKTLLRYAALAVHPDRPGGSVESMRKVNAAAELLRRGPAPTALGLCAMRPREADIVMRFGKHRGLPMGQLPMGYLGWLAEDFSDGAIRAAARVVLHWRTAA
jgi:uncharacterized protein (DUF3820 family)